MSTISSAPTNSAISFRNSQSHALSAHVLRMRRYTISFEIYNPHSDVQLSEVLRDFRIKMNGRLVYEGSAVVSSIVNTGILLVCEATLGSGWRDVDFLASAKSGGLVSQFDEFFDDWKRAHRVSADFKLHVADMQSMMMGLKGWLEQIDLGIQSLGKENQNFAERQVLQEIEGRITEELLPHMANFEASTRNISIADQAAHKLYVRKQIHPYMLCSPFAHRAYVKPLGYAGDYEVVDMMMRDPYEGDSLFAKLLNRVFLGFEPVQAHRNRIDYLFDTIKQEAQRVVGQGRRLKVLNLGCGSAHEIQRFFQSEEISDYCDFTLLDFNQETVDHAKNILSGIKDANGRNGQIQIMQRSVHQLLKQASSGSANPTGESYDLVYCAGLFDYLSQRVCKKLVELFTQLLRPQGLAVVTNVASSNPCIGWMEYLVEWNLVYRNDWQMLDLIPLDGTVMETDVKREATGVNLFLEIRKVSMNPFTEPSNSLII